MTRHHGDCQNEDDPDTKEDELHDLIFSCSHSPTRKQAGHLKLVIVRY